MRDGLTQITGQHVLMRQRTYSPQVISEYEGSGYTILKRCSVGDYLVIRILVPRNRRKENKGKEVGIFRMVMC